MLSELLAILFKNMIPINNFQLMVLEQNYQMAKESFQKCSSEILFCEMFKVDGLEQKWAVILTFDFRISGPFAFEDSPFYHKVFRAI